MSQLQGNGQFIAGGQLSKSSLSAKYSISEAMDREIKEKPVKPLASDIDGRSPPANATPAKPGIFPAAIVAHRQGSETTMAMVIRSTMDW